MQRRDGRFFLAGLSVLLLLAGLIGPAGPSVASPAEGKIEPEVLAQLDQGKQGTFLVYLAEQADLSPAYQIRDWSVRGWFVYSTLREVAERTQPAVLQALDMLRVRGHVGTFQPYYVVNLIVVHGDLEAARVIADLPEVAAVYPELKIELIKPVATSPAPDSPQVVEWNIQRIGADQVWATYGVTGTGSVAANIDTGVEYNHPALVRQYRGNLGGGSFDHNYNWWDPTFQYAYPYPIEGGHGTHVMGTEIGEDATQTNQIGVAPGAKWIAAYGCCPDNEALLSATQWMIAPTDLSGNNPDPDQRPHVVNNSWSGPGGSLIFNQLLESQRAAGIFPAFAASNAGPGCATLGSPGDNPTAFNTGATNSSDVVVGFSSRGPDPFHSWMGHYGVGPAIVAPGSGIRSSLPGGGYGSSSGTSMASPHSAGAVALLWSAEPDLVGRVEETAEILRRTAVPFTSAQTCGGVPGTSIPNNTYGWGLLDVFAAVEMMWQAGILRGTVRDAGTGDPVAAAQVNMQRNGYTLATETDSGGVYEFPLGAGTYTITVNAYGYDPATQGGVVVQQDLTTTLDLFLTALVTHTLSGVIQESTLRVPGDPIEARIGLYATDVDVTTDPASGAYSTAVAEGSYWMRVTARGYLLEDRTITVTGDLSEDFALIPRWTYYARDSRSPCGPTFEWIDATDGTPHNLSDDGSFSVDLSDYPFFFYGSSYNDCNVNANGFISFGQIYGAPHMVFPFEARPNNSVYGLTEDLNPAGGAQGIVYDKMVDNRYLVVEFYQVEHWEHGYPETFEFILDTETGAILVQYQEVSWPDFTSVGVENEDGTDGLVYSYANSAHITNGLAVGFYPVFGPPPADQDESGVLGTLSGTVYISGTTTPVPGAEVTAASFLHVFSATADLAGNYLFPDVCADLYRLQATAAGYAPSAQVEARLRWGGDVVVNDLFVQQPCDPVHNADFTWEPLTPTVGQVITFTGVASGTTPIDYAWDLGDSGQAAGNPVTHTYAAGGAYTVVMTATNCGVYTDTAAYAVTAVAPRISVVPPAPPAPLYPGEQLTGTMTIQNWGNAALSWTLEEAPPVNWLEAGPLGGTIAPGGDTTVLLTYTAPLTPGLYTTTLRVHSNDPLEPQVDRDISLTVMPCVAVWNVQFDWLPLTPTVGQAVTFTAAASGTAPITFTWDFGDGSGDSGAMVIHTFMATSTYTVTLTAANCVDDVDVVTHRVTVTGVEQTWKVYLPLVFKGAP